MKNWLTRLSRIPLCRVGSRQSRLKIFQMIAPARQNGLKMFNMITFFKHGRITTVVIKHIVFEKQCL